MESYNLTNAAKFLGVSRMTLHRMVKRKELPDRQGGAWGGAWSEEELNSVKDLLAERKKIAIPKFSVTKSNSSVTKSNTKKQEEKR